MGALSPCTGYSDDQLVARGDRQVEWLVQAIINSNTWQRGRNALFVVWDQGNGAPLQAPAVAIAVTNYCVNWVQDPTPYTHYSLLKTIEVVFPLPFLGHATDSTTKTMAPMLTRVHDNHNDDCPLSQEHNE